MNTPFTLSATVLCVALMASAQAHAQDQRIEITGDRAAAQALQVAGEISRDGPRHFLMETGRKLEVASRGSALRVRYGHQGATTVRHDGAGNFVSADGVLALRFERDAQGQPDLVYLTLPSSWR
jgi:hypothetical protein